MGDLAAGCWLLAAGNCLLSVAPRERTSNQQPATSNQQPAATRLEMVWLRSRTSLGSELPLSSGLYVDALPNATSFTGFAAFRSWPYTVTSEGDAEQIPGSRVTPSFFPVIGVRPLLGRTFGDTDAEPGAAQVAIIGHDLWQRRFGGNPAVLGRRIELGNESFTIIGVMPPGFAFPRAIGRRTLVIVEVSLSLMLLIGASLLARSFVRLQRAEPGFVPDQTLSASIVLPIPGGFDPKRDGPGWARFFSQLTMQLAKSPNVESVGSGETSSDSHVPSLVVNLRAFVGASGRPAPRPPVESAPLPPRCA